MKHSILSVAVFFAALGNAQALQTVGNGGDILKCMESPGKTEATYVLDELICVPTGSDCGLFQNESGTQKALPRFYSEYVFKQRASSKQHGALSRKRHLGKKLSETDRLRIEVLPQFRTIAKYQAFIGSSRPAANSFCFTIRHFLTDRH